MPILHLTKNQVIFWVGMIFLRIILGAFLPITNDEAYYWDWGQNLQLSYMDHPPFVSWVSFLSDLFASNFGNLKARFMVIVCHIFSTIFILGATQSVHQNSRTATWGTLVLTQLIPGLHFLGMALLPDAPLLLCLSITLHIGMQMSFGGKSMSPIRGLIIGLLGGLAICSKYHAFVLFPGIVMALLWHRSALGLPLTRYSFYLALVFGVIIGSCPVWIWNMQHEWISLRFQSDHGFGGLSFNPTFALRTLLGQWIILTPIVWFLPLLLIYKELIKLLKPSGRRNWRHHRLLLIVIFLPLFGLLFSVAPFKQSLPHWVLPAYWCAIPFISRSFNSLKKRIRYIAFGWAILISGIFPLALVSTPAVEMILDQSAGKPRGISEVTLWDHMDKEVTELYEETKNLAKDSGEKCKPVLLSLRWFWIAQVRYRNPDFNVVTLDIHHPSYYHYLDSNWMQPGCKAILIGDERHFDSEKLSEWIEVHDKTQLEIPKHEKMPLYSWEIQFRKAMQGDNSIELLYKW